METIVPEALRSAPAEARRRTGDKRAAIDVTQSAPDAVLQSRQVEWIARRFHTTPSRARIFARLAFENGRVEVS